MFAWSGGWTTVLPLHTSLSASHFHLSWLFKQFVWHFTKYWACSWKIWKVWDFLLMWLFRDSLFVLQKFTNEQNILFGVTKICKELCGTMKVWVTVSSKTFFLKMLSLNILQRGHKMQIFEQFNGERDGNLGWPWLFRNTLAWRIK